MKTQPITDITLFCIRRVADLTKDLTKLVHLPASAFTCLHPAAFAKTQLSPDLAGISCTSRWNITLYIGGKMSALSCNDDAGHDFTHPLISLAIPLLAFGFAQTFAHLVDNPAKHISSL